MNIRLDLAANQTTLLTKQIKSALTTGLAASCLTLAILSIIGLICATTLVSAPKDLIKNKSNE